MTRPVTSQQTAHDLGRRALTVVLMTLMSWCFLGVARAAPASANRRYRPTRPGYPGSAAGNWSRRPPPAPGSREV